MLWTEAHPVHHFEQINPSDSNTTNKVLGHNELKEKNTTTHEKKLMLPGIEHNLEHPKKKYVMYIHLSYCKSIFLTSA